jgi:RES domain-containing protein
VTYGQTVRRGGAYNRLADPSWADPLDTTYSMAWGGRWNVPGAFGALYLNRDPRMARLQVHHKLAGQPFDVEDLDPSEQHDLIEVRVDDCDPLDCVTASGLTAVGLPAGYPLDEQGQPVARDACQTVSAEAFATGHPGVACRSAAAGANVSGEELAVFDRDAGLVHQTARRPFSDWYFDQR